VKRILAWTGGGLAVLLALAGGGVYWLYAHLDGNIKHEKADSSTLGTSRPVKLNSSTNILLMGIDSRAGTGGAYGVDEGEDNSDTMILLHISPNGDHAVGISFPRDSMVNVPSCKEKSGEQSKPYFGMINSAVSVGGPLCTWKTIEANTGVHIDHFVLVDFNGFKRVVNALGGVEICLPKPVDDPRANLDLPAGKQVVKGDAALAYVRERYALGDGSDLGRIKRQQKFMSSVVKKALSTDMLTDPIREYQFLDAATKSITVDDGLTIGKMRSLAGSLKGITSGKVQFVTVPNHPYPADPNRVQWDADTSKTLFAAIAKDNNLPAAPTAPATPAEPQVPDDQVKITVLQDTKAKAQASAAQLAARGFKITDEGTTKATTTLITYGPGAGTRASALANTIGNLNPVEDPKAPKGTVTLTVGSQGLTFIPPPAAAPTPPPVAGGATADQNLCGPNDD
jgi:LCP family protein required for cell wall assembly